ncbi:MAG: TonB-dependent receptor [Bacteroidia bacterium]|nr:TonB-dependent receptor [Bacteroidia bacterium]
MKRKILLSLLWISSLTLLGQRTITGTITDTDNEPLIGANILIQGTGNGTISDLDGNYTLDIPFNDVILEISYVGYIAQEIEVDTRSVVDIVMQFDVVGLEETIVIGYLPTRRKDVTGSVASIQSDDIEDVTGLGVQTALQGRVSGVMVTRNSGNPGSTIDVRIRGSSSIGSGNEPLFVVDGVPMISGDFSQEDLGGQGINALSDLNPNDIESIEVLKDASSASIYGSRGANGVVLITTKKGKAGKTQVNFNATYGWQERSNKIDLLTADQYKAASLEILGDADAGDGGQFGNTDWQDVVFQTGTLQEYSVNISGGDERTRFYTGLSYIDDVGIIKNTSYERYSARLNIDHIASDRLTLGANFNFNHSKNKRIPNDNNIFGVLPPVMIWPATVPVFNDDGSFGSLGFGLNNPLSSVTLYDNQVRTNRVTGNFFAKFEISPVLYFKAAVGIDAIFLREDIYEPSGLASSSAGSARLGQVEDFRWITDYTLNFQKRWDDHSLVAVAGAGFQEDQIKNSFAQADGFPTDDFRGLTAGAIISNTNGGFTGDRINSYFGNFNYSYRDKYILTGTFRADGSSRFINNQWGYFPGVSVAWRVSSEPFLSNANLDELKLRLGWGQTGNNGVGNFAARQLYGGGANYLNTPGIVPDQIGNPDLTWETTTQFNIGLDVALLDSRLSANIEYYIKDTKDLLLNRPIPTTSGFLSIPENIGEIQNRGFELNLTAIPLSRAEGLNWQFNFNIGYQKNEIQKLVNGQAIDVRLRTRLAEGQPIGSFFGYVTDGIFQNQSEIDAHATQPGAAPGDYRFKDVSGGPGPDGFLGTSDDLAPDGRIDDNDRTYIGNGFPDWTGGMNNLLRFKNWELSAFFQFSLGNEIYNWNRVFADGMDFVWNLRQEAWLGRWQQEGDNEDFPRAVFGDPNDNTRTSDRFVEDGSYLRLKTATLSYALPEQWLGNSGIRKLRIYITGQNLITITDYSWFDPEISAFGESGGVRPGYDLWSYPQPRSVVFGLNVSF